MWKTKKEAFYADYIQIEMCDTHDWNYNYAKLKFETEKREKFEDNRLKNVFRNNNL